MNLEEIKELFDDEELIIVDGFNNAIIGIDPNTMKIIYSRDLMIEVLINEEKMTIEDSIDYLSFNVWSAYVGEKTPIYSII